MASDDLSRTRAVSPHVTVVDSTGSTNADASAAAAADPAAWPHLSVLLTRDQCAGRGRLDRVWQAPAGTALAASVVVRVPRIPASARGWVPLVAGAAMTRAVRARLAGSVHTAGLKWPNDVLVDGAKICGILATVVAGDPHAIVIGSGVNMSATREQLPVATATSFALLGVDVDEDRLLADYLVALDEQLQALAVAGGDAAASGVRGEVESLCTTLGAAVRVMLPNGDTVEGTAVRLDGQGRIVVDAAGGERAISAGDIIHLRPRS